jgi:hypothetical protein
MNLLNAGKVTSLVAKKDVPLATRIEEAIKKNESLEALTTSNVRRPTNPQNASTKGRTPSRTVKSSSALKVTNQKGRRGVVLSSRSSRTPPKDTTCTRRSSPPKSQPKSTKSGPPGKVKLVKSAKTSIKVSKSKSKPVGRKGDALNKIETKLSVVGFRGRSSGKSGQAS